MIKGIHQDRGRPNRLQVRTYYTACGILTPVIACGPAVGFSSGLKCDVVPRLETASSLGASRGLDENERASVSPVLQVPEINETMLTQLLIVHQKHRYWTIGLGCSRLGCQSAFRVESSISSLLEAIDEIETISPATTKRDKHMMNPRKIIEAAETHFWTGTLSSASGTKSVGMSVSIGRM